MGACGAPEGSGPTGGRRDRARGGARAPGHPAQPALPCVQGRRGHRRDNGAPDRAGGSGEAAEGGSSAEPHDAEASMNYEWGRAPAAGKWQRAVPVWFMSVILLALASGVGVWWLRQTFVWTP